MGVKQICPFTNQDCKAICNLWNSQFGQCSLFMLANASHRMSINVAEKINNHTVAINELSKKLDKQNGIVGEALVRAMMKIKGDDKSDGYDKPRTDAMNATYKTDEKKTLNAYHETLDEDSWKTFPNKKTKDEYNAFKKWCNDNGFDAIPEQPMFTRSILRRYDKYLTSDNVGGGTYRLL